MRSRGTREPCGHRAAPCVSRFMSEPRHVCVGSCRSHATRDTRRVRRVARDASCEMRRVQVTQHVQRTCNASSPIQARAARARARVLYARVTPTLPRLRVKYCRLVIFLFSLVLFLLIKTFIITNQKLIGFWLIILRPYRVQAYCSAKPRVQTYMAARPVCII